MLSIASTSTRPPPWKASGRISRRAASGRWRFGRDPELPQAYLGRARLAIRLKNWDLALADLEQAAAWAQSDPPTELAITAAYLMCLPSQPNRFARWLALAGRTMRDFRADVLR